MKSFLPIIFLCIFRNVLGHWIQQERIDYDDELSYQELINKNASCYPLDSCMKDRNDNPYEPAFGYHCSCHRECWEFGTCCIDSPYRFKSRIQKCMNVGVTLDTNNYYLVYRCPDNTSRDSVWKSECEKEWNGEDNILMLSPVTSLETSKTYKNYYCFRCHETTDKYVSWNLLVDSVSIISEEINIYNVFYNQEQSTWMVTSDENHASFPANLSFQHPHDLQSYPISCTLNLNVIEDCPDTWTDRRVHRKCLAYTAFVYQGYLTYKNIHCAECNSAPLENITCESYFSVAYGKKIFSFRNLLNINDSIKDKVGKDGNCDKDHMWDPYSKICRKKSCALPGYIIQNDRCVPP